MVRRHFLASVGARKAICMMGGKPSTATNPVRIACSVSKTGLFAEASPTQTNARYFWADQVNTAGGIDIASWGKRPCHADQL